MLKSLGFVAIRLTRRWSVSGQHELALAQSRLAGWTCYRVEHGRCAFTGRITAVAFTRGIRATHIHEPGVFAGALTVSRNAPGPARTIAACRAIAELQRLISLVRIGIGPKKPNVEDGPALLRLFHPPTFCWPRVRADC